MKTYILICATCFIVTGCSAQLRFPSLSSALSSLTGFGAASNQAVQQGQQAQPSSPYSGLVRDYGRNLMMAMSNIYPTLFKPPQQQQAQPSQQASQSPYEQAFGASQYSSQGLFPSQSAPSFSFGGSTFSISPSLPFGALSGGSSSGPAPQASSGSHSPFSASFGSSINSPSTFGPLSSASLFQQSASMPSAFAPSSSYNGAFDAANSAPSAPSSFGSLSSGAGSQMHQSSAPMISQSSNSNPINSYPSIQAYGNQHDSSPILSQPNQAQQVAQQGHPQPQFQQHQQPSNQFASQQYRPDMMSIAASAPVPSSNSYSNYGNMPAASSQQHGTASQSSYQQPSYR